MRYLVVTSLFVVGLMHFFPAYGVLGPEQILSLYGTPVSEPNIELLMRHRAVLLGLVGVFMMVAAFRRALQLAAFILGLASVVSFLYLAWSVGAHNSNLSRVVVADMFALALLLVGAAAFAYSQRRANLSLERRRREIVAVPQER